MNFRMRAAPITETAIGHTSHAHSTDNGGLPATIWDERKSSLRLPLSANHYPARIPAASQAVRWTLSLPPSARPTTSITGFRWLPSMPDRVANSQEVTTSRNIPAAGRSPQTELRIHLCPWTTARPGCRLTLTKRRSAAAGLTGRHGRFKELATVTGMEGVSCIRLHHAECD